MDTTDFIETVQEEAPLETRETAHALTVAVLQTLGERITEGQASDLAEALPADLAEPLENAPSEAEPFSLAEFIERISSRADLERTEVRHATRGVASAIAMASHEELVRTRDQLPTEFDVFFEPGGPVTETQFLERVRARASLESTDEAAAITTTTLQALSDRLSAGQAADLAHYLPEPLAAELEGQADEAARDSSFQEFLETIANEKNFDVDDAEYQIRAVGSVLAEAASDREVEATRKQLPDQFGAFFDAPREDVGS